MCLQSWPFLMLNPMLLTPAGCLTPEDEAQTLRMALNIISLSLLLLILDFLTYTTCLSIFLGTGAENQELSLTDSLVSRSVTGCTWLILLARCSSNKSAPSSLHFFITTTTTKPSRVSQLPLFILVL